MIRIEMEMPESCYDCPFNDGEYEIACYEKRYCKCTGHAMKKDWYKKRPKECPLKEEVITND